MFWTAAINRFFCTGKTKCFPKAFWLIGTFFFNRKPYIWNKAWTSRFSTGLFKVVFFPNCNSRKNRNIRALWLCTSPNGTAGLIDPHRWFALQQTCSWPSTIKSVGFSVTSARQIPKCWWSFPLSGERLKTPSKQPSHKKKLVFRHDTSFIIIYYYGHSLHK